MRPGIVLVWGEAAAVALGKAPQQGDGQAGKHRAAGAGTPAMDDLHPAVAMEHGLVHSADDFFPRHVPSFAAMGHIHLKQALEDHPTHLRAALGTGAFRAGIERELAVGTLHAAWMMENAPESTFGVGRGTNFYVWLTNPGIFSLSP